MKIAVLDLGTNVFNLLTARISKSECNILNVYKVGSNIGRGGFRNGNLSEESVLSALEAIGQMVEVIERQGGVDEIACFATSAVRDASNKEILVKAVKERFNIDIMVISGDREAELIYKGIRESLLLYNEKVLMVDIGGGSNELIIADKERIYYKESFPLGVIRMKEIINPSDPITRDEIKAYTDYLDSVLSGFFENIKTYSPSLMIGASGSFDTLRELIFPQDNGEMPAMELPLKSFSRLHNRLLASTKQERFAMAGMSPLRAEYMVLGSIFVEYLIRKVNIKELYQSSYSLKEGYMAERAEIIEQ